MKNRTTKLIKRGLTAIALATLLGCVTPQRKVETPRMSPTNCYLHLFIKESIKQKTLGKKVEFRLDSFETVKENVSHLVYPHTKTETSAYHVETYDEYGKIIGIYELPSGRFLIAEDFSGKEPKGEIIELKENSIDCYIPYSPDIKAVKIENNRKRTHLLINLEKLCK